MIWHKQQAVKSDTFRYLIRVSRWKNASWADDDRENVIKSLSLSSSLYTQKLTTCFSSRSFCRRLSVSHTKISQSVTFPDEGTDKRRFNMRWQLARKQEKRQKRQKKSVIHHQIVFSRVDRYRLVCYFSSCWYFPSPVARLNRSLINLGWDVSETRLPTLEFFTCCMRSIIHFILAFRNPITSACSRFSSLRCTPLYHEIHQFNHVDELLTLCNIVVFQH